MLQMNMLLIETINPQWWGSIINATDSWPCTTNQLETYRRIWVLFSSLYVAINWYLSLCILVCFEFSDSWDRDTSVSISSRSVLWKVIDLSPLSCCHHIMGGCPDINSCNADNNRTYQRKLLLEWRYNVSSITISTDLCRGKCIKQINSSGEFPGFASGTPKERKKTGLYDTYTHIRLVQGSRKERYLFCWSWKLKLTLHSYNWRRPILHPMKICKYRS